ncbi:MAG TPA: conjugal transfer protein TrbL family protein [Ktedonobacteraceae bacterium]|nr:conjugal transfer protein TrbL family protein [Ktedonobacteraceae bacterium]
MIFGFNLLQWIVDRLTDALNALSGPIAPLVNLISSTPLEFTTQNAIVIAGWRTMTTVADVLLGLFIVIGAIQIMYGDTTGSLRMPVGQFVGKAILTAILIHLSALIGEQLLVLNNLLCGLVTANIQNFVQGVNNGQLFNNGQAIVLAIVMTIVFGIGLFRVIFQAIKRVILFNVLFVLSGPAFLTSFHPATAPVFSGWIRLYIVTIFEQFIQFLTLGLGLQFLIATKQNGLTGFILAIAMLNLAAEIPALLARFGAAAGGQGGGLGSLLNTAVKAAVLLA